MATDLNALIATNPCVMCYGPVWRKRARAAILCALNEALGGAACDPLAPTPFTNYLPSQVLAAQAALATALVEATDGVTYTPEDVLADDPCLLCYPEAVVEGALVVALCNVLAAETGTACDPVALVEANPCLACLTEAQLDAFIASLLCAAVALADGTTTCTDPTPWTSGEWVNWPHVWLPAQLVAVGGISGFEERFAANADGELVANEDGEIIKIGL